MEYEEKIRKLQEYVDSEEKIVFFGGAGVSTESGVPDFRSPDGLYHQKYKYPPETILSHSFYMSNKKEFFRYYFDKLLVPGIKPNKAHLKLAEMEKKGRLSSVITQNIDGLHQKAGNRNVLELHGSVNRNYCESCGKMYDASYMLSKKDEGIPRCEICGGDVKPDVVLYEEALNENVIRKAVAEIEQADLLIIGGTSLAVYPAASFIDFFKGDHIVLINKSSTPRDDIADLIIREPIGQTLDRIRV